MTTATATTTTPNTVSIVDEAGTPIGVYDVAYYTIDADGEAVPQSRCDSSLSINQALAISRALGPDECAVVECRSQPGGWVEYGSPAAHYRVQDRRERHLRALMEDVKRAQARRPGIVLDEDTGATLRVDSMGFLVCDQKFDAGSEIWGRHPELVVAARELRLAVEALRARRRSQW